MLLNTEYALNEKWSGKQVYAMVVDYGALPNAKEGSNDTLAANLDIISISGFAVGDAYVVPAPGYYAIQNMGYTKSTGNLWISTTIDMSGYHGYITVKYTK
jgi:ABC-type amino acid transport substrate-binding protein